MQETLRNPLRDLMALNTESLRSSFMAGAWKCHIDAKAWGLTPCAALAIAGFPLVTIGGMAFIAVLSLLMSEPFRPLFLWITAEDSLLEWGQFLCVFAASLILTWLGAQLLHERWHVIGLLYVMIGLGALFVAGEEISWGQRVFGWGTPASLEVINRQHETNIHNIGWVQRTFGYVILLGSMYGSLVPLIRLTSWSDRMRSTLSFLMIPPLFLVPAFLIPFGYRVFRLGGTLDSEFTTLKFTIIKSAEAAELCLYFGLLIFAWLNLRRVQAAKEVQNALISRPNRAGQLRH